METTVLPRLRHTAASHRRVARAGASGAILALATMLAAAACGPAAAPAVATPFVSVLAPEGQRMRDVATPVRLVPGEARRAAFDMTAHCNLDRAGGQPLEGAPVDVSKAAPVLFTGWLVDPRRGNAGSDLRLVIAGTEAGMPAWTSRSVVRKANPGALAARGYDAGMLESSFAFLVDMQDVAPGTYYAYVVFDEASGGAVCDPGRRIRVTG